RLSDFEARPVQAHAVTGQPDAARRNHLVPARSLAHGILAVVVRCDYSSYSFAGTQPHSNADRKGRALMVRLEELTVVQAPIERCFDLARSVEVHLAGNVHAGESALAIGGITSGLIGMGQRVTWR